MKRFVLAILVAAVPAAAADIRFAARAWDAPRYDVRRHVDYGPYFRELNRS